MEIVIDIETVMCYHYLAGETRAGRRTKTPNINLTTQTTEKIPHTMAGDFQASH